MDTLRELVLLLRKKNQHLGLIKIADMVRFSKEMNEFNPDKYPFYNKDVWITYGKTFIDEANEPAPSTLSDVGNTDIVVPNILDILTKHHKNFDKLVEYFKPLELLLHTSLNNERTLTIKNETLQKEVDELKEKLENAKQTIKRYEDFSLEMAHKSYSVEFREEYGLVNQISVNANSRNKNAMRNLNDLDALFTNKPDSKIDNTEETAEDSQLIKIWRNKRNK